MECPEVKRKIDRYLRDELPSEASDRLEAHLRDCPDCRAALEGARGLEDVFRGSASPPVPDGFAKEVRVRAESALPSWRSLSAPWRAAVAASLVVGLALGILMASGGAGRPPRAGSPGLKGLGYLSESPPGSINRAVAGLLSPRPRED